ncbi:hypothetical protein A2U01_0006277 [Trifolium medium]|uniref:Uncharacterized protein n=1 Tax=Trifolium medium TaxID=97028 RepID=A0A392MDQ7_9FABA|nr:hypothetical protein [Trifolium medium]
MEEGYKKNELFTLVFKFQGAVRLIPYRMGLRHITAVPTPPSYKHAFSSGYTLHIKWLLAGVGSPLSYVRWIGVPSRHNALCLHVGQLELSFNS